MLVVFYMSVSVCQCVCVCVCVFLGHSLVSKVGESFKLILVDLLDDAVFHRRQDGLLTCKVLVEVVHIPFGFLQQKAKKTEEVSLKNPWRSSGLVNFKPLDQ